MIARLWFALAEALIIVIGGTLAAFFFWIAFLFRAIRKSERQGRSTGAGIQKGLGRRPGPWRFDVRTGGRG